MENNIQIARPHLETIAKTAELLGLPVYFVRQKVKSGEVVAVTAGRKTFVNVDKFIEYLNTATVKPTNTDTANDEPTTNEFGISPIPRD